MKNPEKYIKEYLQRLTFDFIYLKSIFKDFRSFHEWIKHNGFKDLKGSDHFFSMYIYSNKRILCIDTCKLVSNIDRKNINDFLTRAFEAYSKISPSVYDPKNTTGSSDRRVISKVEYGKLIIKQRSELSKHNNTIQTLLKLRNKAYAHNDPRYFINRKSAEESFPMNFDELESLYVSVAEILRKHHSMIFESDMDMELHALGRVTEVIKRLRAFRRFRENKKLIELGIKNHVFLNDDYDAEDIFL